LTTVRWVTAVYRKGQLSTCADLAEGEGVGLDAWAEEGDLEGAVADRAGLADELVQPRGGVTLPLP
jgi:hypothetical protein